MNGTPSRKRSNNRFCIFDYGDDVEYLVAGPLVGRRFMEATLMSARQVSKRWKEAVDARVDEWCATFTELKKEWMDHGGIPSTMTCKEGAVETLVKMEQMCESSFSARHMAVSSLPYISKMDRVTYYAQVRQMCVLCNTKISQSQQAERENTKQITLSHASCERSNVLSIQCYRVRGMLGSQKVFVSDIHKEAATVCSYKGINLCLQTVKKELSEYYHTCIPCDPEQTYIGVWVRPHPRVSEKDTLYQALKITSKDVEDAENYEEGCKQQFKNNMETRKMAVENKAIELANVSEAEVRVWLGKGKTRWRSIEDLMTFHRDAIVSSQIDKLICPRMRRSGSARSVAAICNAIHLFDASLKGLNEKPSCALLEWIISMLSVHSVFGQPAYEMQYVDSSMIDVAITNEAAVYAKIFGMIELMDQSSIRSCKARVVAPHNNTMNSTEASYAITTNSMCGNHIVGPQFMLTQTEVCKLKFKVKQCLPEHMHCNLPAIPLFSELIERNGDIALAVSDFVSCILRLCLDKEAGKARAIGLFYIVPLHMLKELKTHVSFEASNATFSDVDSDED
jgi:hypothetical protein